MDDNLKLRCGNAKHLKILKETTKY